MGVEPAFARTGAVWPLTLAGPLPREAPDPSFFLPDGVLEKGAREAIEATVLRDQSAALRHAPVEPLGPALPVRNAPRQRKWTAAIVASLAFHAAVAWVFLDENRDMVLIEGSENAGVTMLGNAAEDQLSAGEIEVDATNVTLIEMTPPKPVETVVAEAVPVEEAAEVVPVEAMDTVETAMLAETPTETVEAEMPTASTQAAPEKPVEAAREAPAEPVAATADRVAAVTSTTPEILAVDKIAPIEDETAVARPAESAPADTAEPARAEPVETVSAVAEEPMEAVRETPEPAPKPVEEAKPAKPVEKPAEKAAEKPVKKAEAKPVEKKKPEKKAAKKPAEKKAAAKAEQAPARKKAGSGGANQGDAKKGAADGVAQGTTAAKGKKGKTSNSGNAAVSNYPGKVTSKLRRALRPAGRGLKGEVQVSFRVSASGSVSGVRVSRSSGQPALDKAALDTVRRAAPFPPIPADAGRSSWDFTVPLAFRR